MESHTHKLAMHRRKGRNMEFWLQGGICNVLCVREQWKSWLRDEGRMSEKGKDGNRLGIVNFYRAPSNTPRTSSTVDKSVRKGTKSVNSVSWGSLNHEETGTALFGWKM